MRKYVFAVGLLVVVSAGAYFWGTGLLGNAWSTLFAGVKKNAVPETKADTYQIVQDSKTLPKIIQATIDPPDVHVGDKQKLSIIIQDDARITSVEAIIETDNGTTTLPLLLVGEATSREIIPPKFAVGEDHVLLALGGFNSKSEFPLAKLQAPRITLADLNPLRWLQEKSSSPAYAALGPKLKYENSWTVGDTHDAKYHTTFVVKDDAGRQNSITLAWSDACSIPNNSVAGWNLGSYGNCVISSVDGVDNGGATIATYTLTLNSTFAFNSGQTITVTNGTIAIGASGQILKTNLWKQDADSDTYPNSTQVAQDATPVGTRWFRRYTYGTNADDCNDSNSSVKPSQTGWFTSADSRGSFDYNCSSRVENQYSYQNQDCTGKSQANCTYVWPNSIPACGSGGSIWACSWSGTACSNSVGTNMTSACH